MLIAEIGMVLAIAAVMTLLAVAVCVNLGIDVRSLRIYGILAVGTVAGGHFSCPLGPPILGVQWLPLFMAGLLTTSVCVGCLLLSRRITLKISDHLDGLASGTRLIGESLKPPGAEPVIGRAPLVDPPRKQCREGMA